MKTKGDSHSTNTLMRGKLLPMAVMEAAHYLRIPTHDNSRLGFSGRHYRSFTGVRFSKPIIQVARSRHEVALLHEPGGDPRSLDAIRRKHDIPLEKSPKPR